jgi:hypothetical protein
MLQSDFDRILANFTKFYEIRHDWGPPSFSYPRNFQTVLWSSIDIVHPQCQLVRPKVDRLGPSNLLTALMLCR